MFGENNVKTNSKFKLTGSHKRLDILRKAYQSTQSHYLLKVLRMLFAHKSGHVNLYRIAFADCITIHKETRLYHFPIVIKL